MLTSQSEVMKAWVPAALHNQVAKLALELRAKFAEAHAETALFLPERAAKRSQELELARLKSELAECQTQLASARAEAEARKEGERRALESLDRLATTQAPKDAE